MEPFSVFVIKKLIRRPLHVFRKGKPLVKSVYFVLNEVKTTSNPPPSAVSLLQVFPGVSLPFAVHVSAALF